jgi:hypothetical protein
MRKVRLLILFLVYCLLLVNIILTQKDIFSIEFSSVCFVAAAIIFYILKIDSRFLILPAILGLAYCPFLLIGNKWAFAEDIAIYVYYLLVVGIILQFIEHFKKNPLELKFQVVMKKLLKQNIFVGPSIVLLIATIITWIMSVNDIKYLAIRYELLYFFVVISVFNIISRNFKD